MKEPEPIHYETDEEYYQAMNAYEEHLFNEEFSRLGADKALGCYLMAFFLFILICAGALIYLY